MQYTIWATVRSKKNSRQLGYNQGRMFSIPSKAYDEFKQQALTELMCQKPKDLPPPYKVCYWFYLTGKGTIDLDNAVVSINDVLQEARIIGNDGLIEVITARKIYHAKENKTVIEINQW
jgi:Holliday junction resolvase RusA-like endonuclease